MIVFALNLELFPSFGTGYDFVSNLYYLFLPALALSLNMVALISRITRSNMIEQLNSNYAVTAVAKGIPYRKVVMKHCFKNALIPVITVAGIQIGTMVVGAVLVENVFCPWRSWGCTYFRRQGFGLPGSPGNHPDACCLIFSDQSDC